MSKEKREKVKEKRAMIKAITLLFVICSLFFPLYLGVKILGDKELK
jgi:hypothetical protein